MSIAAIIVAAGKGERAGGGVPKQYRLLAGRPVLAYSAACFASHPAIDHIIIVIGAGQNDQARVALDGVRNVTLVEGGKERQDSVSIGLEAARVLGASKVLIHDAARPLLPAAVIERLINALEISPGAVPVLPVVDTLARGERTLGDTVKRTSLYHIQTPQAFALDAIRDAHQRWTGTVATDDAQMARAAGYDIMLIAGDTALAKLTHEADFEDMESLIAPRMISRTGMGYDVHRLASDEDLWLCGVHIPHDKGLAGHSDADVAIHALVDALLGAAGLGDIGAHFPPSDPQWRGARSALFLEHARNLIIAEGGIIDHVDITIICEAPKIGPHREAMQAELGRLLRLPTRNVSIKATTTERLGFAGRGEGIAAQAVATVRMLSR